MRNTIAAGVLAIAAAGVAGCAGPGAVRVGLVALDGASWRVMRPMMARGELPILGQMVDSGVSGDLKTLDDVRLISPAIWTTIATGKLPEQHGIRDYTQRPAGRRGPRRLVDSTMRRTEAIWTILSRHGMDVGIVGWWATWPAEEVNGFMVTDRFPHTRWEEWHNAEQDVRVVHPPSMERGLLELVRAPGRFRPEELSSLLPMREDVTARLADSAWTRYDPYLELKNTFLEQESYVKAARHLLTQHRPRLFAVYLTLVDVAEHFFWHHMEPQHYPPRVSDADFAQVIKNAYRKADSTIGTFVKELGHGYDWLVVSDHSMLPTGTVPLSGSHYRDRALSSPVGYTDQELSLDGVIIGWGPHMRRSAAVEGASIVDVTPTILYMMDVPVGRDMTGRPLLDLLAPGLTKHRQTRIVESHDHAGDPAAPPGADPGEHRLRQKLKALGYLG